MLLSLFALDANRRRWSIEVGTAGSYQVDGTVLKVEHDMYDVRKTKTKS